MDKPVIILGADGLGKAAYEIFISHNITIYCFLDDRKDLHGTEINEVPVLGSTDDEEYLKHIGQKCEAFIALDENEVRKSLVKMLNDRRKVMPVNAVHDHARIAGSASISHGNFINEGATLGANSVIGNHNLIHAGATIDFDVNIGDYVQIGQGAVLCPGVKAEDEVFIGAGAVIVGGITIGKKARVGAGSVVIENIDEGTAVFGNPAKPVKI